MKDGVFDESVIESLRTALATKAIPTASREHASHLIKRLSSPVRVSILGSPGSGKSELLNMFAGRRILPKGAKHPTMEVSWGPKEKVVVTDASGQLKEFAGLDFDVVSKSVPAFIRIEMPLPLLKRISLLEIVTNGSLSEMQSAIDWAIRRTDIALWCTQTFSSDERVLWSRVPDALKDHAFLVLTKADILSAENALSSRIAKLETIVAEEFHSMFAVATLQALKALNADGSINEAVYHASGGGALSAEILRHSERGRRADFDSAHLFLARFQVRAVSEPEPVEEHHESVEAPQEQAAVPERMETEPQPQTPSISIEEAVENVAIFQESASFLRRRADSLSETVSRVEPGATRPVVDQCVDAVEHLVDLFSQDDSGCVAVDAFIDDLTEAEELMVLMQAEQGDAPAADAVTLLLQLKREMEMKLAA